MSDLAKQENYERTNARLTCSSCGKEIYAEDTISGPSIDVPYRMVQGSFIQSICEDDESPDFGLPYGPVWPFCPSCVKSGKTKIPLQYLEGQKSGK